MRTLWLARPCGAWAENALGQPFQRHAAPRVDTPVEAMLYTFGANSVHRRESESVALRSGSLTVPVAVKAGLEPPVWLPGNQYLQLIAGSVRRLGIDSVAIHKDLEAICDHAFALR